MHVTLVAFLKKYESSKMPNILYHFNQKNETDAIRTEKYGRFLTDDILLIIDYYDFYCLLKILYPHRRPS